MATPDLAQLQALLESAQTNADHIAAIKKAYAKVETAMDEFSKLLSDDYQPVKKERKPRDPNAPTTGKRPGRPKKNQAAE